MPANLRILLIEDNLADAELIERALELAGFSFALKRIQTGIEFRHELETAPPDLILSDHGLPAFSGFKALEIIRAERPELPFIFVSGSNDQGMVVEMYDQGAAGYVFKRDLGDLPAAIREAMEPGPETGLAAASTPSPLPVPDEPQPPHPAGQSAPLVLTPAIGHLRFCPCCRRTLDEAGQHVLMEDYCCAHYHETIVIQELCEACRSFGI